MRELIVKLGRLRSTVAITIICILFSVVITLSVLYLLHRSYNFSTMFIGAVIAPLFVAPIIGWTTVGLILEIHKLEEEMRLLATHDSLTGVLSRRAFFEQTNYICRFAERQGMKFTVLLIDLDHFKKINDKYGHAAGDRVLKSFGKIMRQISRESDLAGRIGGEEFAFFLPATDTKNAFLVADRLHKAIKENIIEWNGKTINFTTSIGLAFFPRTVNNIENALNSADKALYTAKKRGRNQTVVYDVEFEKIEAN